MERENYYPEPVKSTMRVQNSLFLDLLWVYQDLVKLATLSKSCYNFRCCSGFDKYFQCKVVIHGLHIERASLHYGERDENLHKKWTSKNESSRLFLENLTLTRSPSSSLHSSLSSANQFSNRFFLFWLTTRRDNSKDSNALSFPLVKSVPKYCNSGGVWPACTGTLWTEQENV